MSKTVFRHGISNPASGGLKSVPVAGKDVADSKGEALIEWIASVNSEIRNFQRLESLQEATPQERSSYKGRLLPCKM
eukprot:2237067-Prorocentrum_lima.AAC.1